MSPRIFLKNCGVPMVRVGVLGGHAHSWLDNPLRSLFMVAMQ